MLKKVVLATTGALLALTVGAAGAYFTAQVQVPDSIVRAGDVAVSIEPTSAALSVDRLAPGETVARQVTVHNAGTLAADVIVTASKKAGSTEFYEALTCRVYGEGQQLYTGPLSGLRTSALRLNPGARTELCFNVGLPADASNSLAGDYAKLSLYFDAEQAH